MRALLSDRRLEAIAGLPAAASNELGTWITPEPSARLSGASVYIVYTADGDVSRNYSGFARYGSGGGSTDGLMYLQTRETGSDAVQMRVDMSGGGSSNVGIAFPGGRLAGRHIVSCVINEGCTTVTGSLDGGALLSRALTPGNGMPRERLIIDTGASPQTVPSFAIAYNAEHSLATRRRIEAYLRSASASVLPQTSAPIFNRTGTGTSTFTAAQTPSDPVTVYAVWPGGLRAAERASIASPAWLALGRAGDGRGFAMRQSISGSTVISYAEPVITENVPIVMSATADGSKLTVMSLGDGAPRSGSINCGPAQAEPVNITTSGTAAAPTVQIYRGVHSNARRETIMRMMAERYGANIGA